MQYGSDNDIKGSIMVFIQSHHNHQHHECILNFKHFSFHSFRMMKIVVPAGVVYKLCEHLIYVYNMFYAIMRHVTNDHVTYNHVTCDYIS